MDTAKSQSLSALKNGISVNQFVFKNKTSVEKQSLIADIDAKWCQFQAVCDSLLTADEIRSFQNSMDYVVVISLRKYVLGYALATEVRLNNYTKSLFINSLCARSLPIKTQLINICAKNARENTCQSLHLNALLSDERVYKGEGFKRSEVQFACDQTHNNEADAVKFKREIENVQREMEIKVVLKDIEKKFTRVAKVAPENTTKLERLKKELYKSFYSDQPLSIQIVLRGIIESGIVELGEVMVWTTKKDFKRKLAKIARQFTPKVPMTKCLIDLGGAGSGAGSGDSGGQGGRATKRARSDAYGGGGSAGERAHKKGKGKGKQKAKPGSDPHGEGNSAGGGVIDLTLSDSDDGNESHSGETTDTDDEVRRRIGESDIDFNRRFYANDTDTEIDEA